MRKLTEDERKFLTRLNTGDYIVQGTGNLFWANENHKGCLKEALTCDEKDMLWKFQREGIIKHEITYK